MNVGRSNPTPISLFQKTRKSFHATLLSSGVLCLADGVPSNADRASAASVAIATSILTQIQSDTAAATKLPGQASGNKFEQITRSFIEETFPALGHLRPGQWHINPQHKSIARFEQYHHLLDVQRLAEEYPQLASVLGRDYIIAPDIVIAREPESDETINSPQLLLDNATATRASLRRRSPDQPPILHASISCKWTIRSDRVQNSRSEALNLVRNRKGKLPHIVVVTGEPLPSRLASIALGTGDIDCVYHFALPELIRAVVGMGDTEGFVSDMVEGKRLKDISDLPLDLAV
ncbi:MAG TPA: NgoMIV family type II restriction endonuclease [Terriglobales bacterium]|nr:NgoMIV family type II restriction endonuclease [Terriglobales bacterium]